MQEEPGRPSQRCPVEKVRRAACSESAIDHRCGPGKFSEHSQNGCTQPAAGRRVTCVQEAVEQGGQTECPHRRWLGPSAAQPRGHEGEGGDNARLADEARLGRTRRQGGPVNPRTASLALVMLLLQHAHVRGDRAGDSLFLDGGQEPFNLTDPPSPGFVYLTPRKSARGLPPWVSCCYREPIHLCPYICDTYTCLFVARPSNSAAQVCVMLCVLHVQNAQLTERVCVHGQFEFPESFSIQLWIRPKRIFIGTEVEGGIVGCLVRNQFGSERAGYGLTVTADALLHFQLTVDVITASLDYEIEVEKWMHLTLQYDHMKVEATMWISFGDGNAPILAASHKFNYDGPKSVNYYIHNDMLLGLFQPLLPLDNPPLFYYSGYIEELRFWSRTIGFAEMTDSLYRGYKPVQEDLQKLGMLGYYPMNAVQCTDELCGGVVGMQQWIHVGRSSALTSALVLYASPIDQSQSLAGLDCRRGDQPDPQATKLCICHEFSANYCWDEIEGKPTYCNLCGTNLDSTILDGLNAEKEFTNCIRVACYGPYGAPKCLQPVLVNGGNPVATNRYEVEINTCIEGNDVQKWTKGMPGTYYQLMSAANAIMCLSTQKTKPFRGSAVFLEACTFEQDASGTTLPPPEFQAWKVDENSLSLKNKLTGFCVSSSALDNGAIPYLIDCVTLDVLDQSTPVKNFLFDWASGRSGVLIGSAYLTSDTVVDRCDGLNLCDPTVKAPIEQKPIITYVNSEPLRQYQMEMEAYANVEFVVTVTARDPNLNDMIQFDFVPFDLVLQTHPSVKWPHAFVCDGGPRDDANCTCNDFACTAPAVCPVGQCSRNPLNSCPSNPCTRVFVWTPIPFTEFLNPATLIFIARDIPVNELPGPVAQPRTDVPLQISTTVRMPPQFEPPTPVYYCRGGLYDGLAYKSLVGCQTVCEAEGRGKCVPTRFEVVIGETVCFKVRAISLEPDSTIKILFLSEGTSFISPPESRVTTSDTLPTVILVEEGGVLVEQLVMNPVERDWCFTPNSIDARVCE